MSMNLVDKMIAWETGGMSEEEAVEFFQKLVDTNIVWQLQGSYGRTAQALIDTGLVTRPTKPNFRTSGKEYNA